MCYALACLDTNTSCSLQNTEGDFSDSSAFEAARSGRPSSRDFQPIENRLTLLPNHYPRPSEAQTALSLPGAARHELQRIVASPILSLGRVGISGRLWAPESISSQPIKSPKVAYG